ncbi:MAG: SprT family zinc-dependent metalloprotease [Candidatus Thermoplasmatota archaeon]|nr:SprT family zinc-dependent metalloprotease [Candidatus Thermoplasmatota archaeon]
MKTLEITYGDQKIPFILVRSKRKTIETRVRPDGSVEVRAPSNLSIKRILEVVNRRGRWIIKKRVHFQQYPREDMKKRYVGGETHRYLGKQYRLKIIPSEDHKVKMKGKFIEVHTPDSSPLIVEELLYNWYMRHAEMKFDQILDDAMKVVKKYGIKRPEMKIKRMKRRWGSCIPQKNRIHLNLELIRTPPYCIEYVIYHELVHLKEPNHQKEYYRLLNIVQPDWKKNKKDLERFTMS